MAGPHRQHPEHRHRRPQRGDTEAGHDPTGGAHGEEPAGPDAAPDAVRGLSVAQNGYQLEALSAPRRVGQDGTLTFRLTGPDGRPVTDYTTAHDKDLHLIVVRTDGTRFRHVHPTMDGEGTWSLPWRWTVAGSYRVFADFVPAATGETLTLTSTVEVAGTVQPAPLGPDRTRTAVDGFTVTVDGAPVTGGSAELRFNGHPGRDTGAAAALPRGGRTSSSAADG